MNQAPNSSLNPARQATAREFLAVVFRRKWLIVGLFLTTTATVAVLSFTTPLVYQSVGRVLIKRGEKENVLMYGRQVYSQWEEELASELEIVRSQPVLDHARRLLAARPGPAVRLEPKQVDCEVMGKSNVLAIAYVDRDPEVPPRVAQAVIDAYMEFRQNSMSLAYPKQFFDDEIRTVDTDLRRLTEERRSFVSREGVVDLVEQRRAQLSLMQNLEQQRSEVAADLAQARSEQGTMRELQTRPEVDLPTVGPAVGMDPLFEIKRRIVEHEAKLAELRERYQDESREVAHAESTIATLRGMLKRDVDARLEVSEARVSSLTERWRSIDQDIAVVKADLASMPAKEARIAELDREIGGLKLRYDGLMEKSGDAKITEFTSLPIKVLLLSAPSAATPKTARDYVRLSLAPAFSIVVGIGLAFFVDGLDLTVRTAGHAEEVAELPVLATVNERRRRRTDLRPT